MNRLIKRYLSDSLWRKNENANVNESFSNLQYTIASNTLAGDFLRYIPRDAAKAHIEGRIHIHNLESGGFIPYCAGHSLKRLLSEGIRTASVSSKPAKHFDSLMDQIVNFLYCSQQEFAGAQSFSDFDTLVAPFIKADGLSYREIKQSIQKLIFNLNMTMRAANQTPFTNLTLNYGCPSHLRDEYAIVGGRITDILYSDCLDEIAMVDRAISEVLLERDADGKPFTFPLFTIDLTRDFRWDTEEAYLMAIVASELGSYYWMNYVGSGIDPGTIRSMCCRLNIDLKQLASSRGIWNTPENTGSLGVVTINLPRLAYESRSDDEMLHRLEGLCNLAIQILLYRKQRILKYMRKLMPFSLMNGWSLDYYYLTIGVIGMWEMALNRLGASSPEDYIDYIRTVISFIREWSLSKQDEIGCLINVEMVPGEGSSYRLAFIDRKIHRNIITSGTSRAPYYSSVLIPHYVEMDLFDRLSLEERVLPLFTGGTVFRILLGEYAPTADVTLKLIRKISESKIPYFDITCTYSICVREGKLIRGVYWSCPSCGSKTEVYARVVGYYRPVHKWNIGKQQEFLDRKYVTSLDKLK